MLQHKRHFNAVPRSSTEDCITAVKTCQFNTCMIHHPFAVESNWSPVVAFCLFFFFFLGIKHSSVWHPVLQNSHHLHDSILRNIQSYPYHKYWEESPSVLLSFSYLRTKLLKPTNLNSNCCQFSFWTSAFLQNSSTARDGRKLPLMFCWKRNTAMNKG